MKKHLLIGLLLTLYSLVIEEPTTYIEFEAAYPNAETVSISNITYKDGLYYFKEKAFNGNIVAHYENEKLKYLSQVFDGRLHGLTTEYFPQGEVKAERNYYLGKLHGAFTEYFQNGKIRVQADVKNNNYHGGEDIERLTVYTVKKGKIRSKTFERAKIIFVSPTGEHHKSSEGTPIYEQNHFIITNPEGTKILLEVK